MAHGNKDKKFKLKSQSLPPTEFYADSNYYYEEKSKAQELRNSQWWKIKRSEGRCYYCGQKFDPEELTMDHLLPLSQGGRSEKANIVPCCKDCNNKKKNLLPWEWQKLLDEMKKTDSN